MFRQFLDVLSNEAGRGMQTLVRLALVSGLVFILGALSVVLGILGVYGHLRETEGAFAAAMILCGSLAFAAMIAGVWMRKLLAEIAVPPINAGLAAEKPVPKPLGQDEMIALAIRTGQTMTPGQTMALALIAGILTGRKIK